MMEDSLRGTHTTLTTSIAAATPTLHGFSEETKANIQALLAGQRSVSQGVPQVYAQSNNDSSTINGVVIGLLSSFGSAILIAFIFLVVYFFRYTSGGRILLDRIGRPGEYDDEQAFAREEAEALEGMDDLQRTEYLRAKGIQSFSFRKYMFRWRKRLTSCHHSIHPSKSTRLITDRHFIVTIFSDSRKGCISVGI